MNQSLIDVSFSLPSLPEVLAVLTLRAGYNSAVVVAGSSLLGLAGGVVGTFALLRKRALVGDAVAHCALPGIAIAFILSVFVGDGERSLGLLLGGAALAGVIGVLVIQMLTQATRLTEDAAIASTLSVFFAFGVLLLSVIQSLGTGREAGLSKFIYGQTAAMRLQDAQVTLVAAIAVILCCFFCFKEFRLLCFDREFAVVQGGKTTALDLVLLSLIVLVTVVGLQSVGLLLVVALLIVPAAAAQFWSTRLTTIVVLSAGFGALSGYLGAATSSLLPRFPAGAVIVLMSGVLFIASILLAPRRGFLAQVAGELRLRIRIGRDHLLREAYERVELEGEGVPVGTPVPVPLRPRGWSFSAMLLLAELRRLGLVRRAPDSQAGRYLLTDSGLVLAQRLTRNHRLWEEYIFSQGNIAVTHLDYSADIAEHVLSTELIAELEAALVRRGRLPDELLTLASPHPLGRPGRESASGGDHD